MLLLHVLFACWNKYTTTTNTNTAISRNWKNTIFSMIRMPKMHRFRTLPDWSQGSCVNLHKENKYIGWLFLCLPHPLPLPPPLSRWWRNLVILFWTHDIIKHISRLSIILNIVIAGSGNGNGNIREWDGLITVRVIPHISSSYSRRINSWPCLWPVASPAMGHWGTCPLDFQHFHF